MVQNESLPDPLADGHIEGQNPATPERLPGHTRYYRRGAAQRYSGPGVTAFLIAALAVALVLTFAAIFPSA